MKKIYYIFFTILSLVFFPVVFASAQAGIPPSSAGTASDAPLQQTTTPSVSPASPAANPKSSPVSPTKPAVPKIIQQPSAAQISQSAPVKQSAASVSASNHLILWASILAALLAVAAFFGFTVSQKKPNKNVNQKKNTCSSIKDLIDQKKQELQELVKDWPQEKLQEMAQDKVFEKLGEFEMTEKFADITESSLEKYEELSETIEMLQKRFDLCTLSLQLPTENAYQGNIIENSLTDAGILKNLNITKNYSVGDWLVHEVLVNEDQVEKLGEFLDDGPWFMHFWQTDGDDAIVVFKDKKFDIKSSDENTWKEVIDYGKSIGIPNEKLNFTVPERK